VSHQNVEIVRRAVAALNRGDFPAALELIHPEAELDWSRRLLDPAVLRGHADAEQFIEETFEIFGDVKIEEEEIIDLGEEVIMVGVARFEGRSSGAKVAARAANVWTVHDGKIVRFQLYQDKESALRAVGTPTRSEGT
jgi:ketosteroid isomerase-like protein